VDRKLEERLRSIEEKLTQTAQAPELLTKSITFVYTVESGKGVRLEEPSPVTGFISEVTMHFPDGCNGLVEMALFYKDRRIFPIKGYIKLNNATPTWTVYHPVRKGEPIWVEILNRDSLNPHTPSVTVVLRGIE